MKLMRKLKLELHHKIIIALILGAIFGAIFNVDQKSLDISSNANNKVVNERISNWDSLIVIKSSDSSVIRTFKSNEQIKIIKYFKKNNEKIDLKYIAYINGQVKPFFNISSISKPTSIATQIKPIGDLFIRLLSFLAIPLVLASLIVGAASLEDISKLGKIGLKTFVLFMVTTAIAIVIGLVLANLIQPGNRISPEAKERLMGTYAEETTEKIQKNVDIDLMDFIITIVPKNPMEALAKGDMLQIVFFAVLLGITLTFIKREHAEPLINFFTGLSEAMIKMVDFIMILAPFGVFALIASTVADFGYEILSTLIWYMLTVIFGLLIHCSVVYSFVVKVFGKYPVGKFFRGIRNAQIIAFSTSSSAATLPVTMECVENMGIPKKIAGFVLPLGATINMDGTALYQGVATVFIAQVFGIELGFTAQLTIILTAVLASIGTAPVPGVGIIMLVMILQSVHIPPEGIAIILGVDRILDMLRTVNNITGDASVAVAVSVGER